MADLDWLTARPIAHRGYHDLAAGRVENTLSAVKSAAERNFAIEIDVHLSADGRVYVFHDDRLDRLTTGSGDTAGLTLAELQAIPFKVGQDRIPSLREVLTAVSGHVPLVIEVKSRSDGTRSTALVDAVARELEAYRGPACVMSFDPLIVEDFADRAPELVRGIVADDAEGSDYAALSPEARAELAGLGHRERTRPHFVSYWVKLLPNAVSRKVREDWRLPLITWTIRTDEDRAAAAAYADQITFEGFDPDA